MNRQQIIIDRIYNQYKDSIFDDVPAAFSNELHEFQLSEFGENSRQQNAEFNQWMYLDNTENKRLYCMIDNQVVGHQGAIAIDLKIDDLRVKGAYAMDLRIADKYQMKGLGVAMIGALINRFDVIIGLGISDNAKKMLIRQGWHDLGHLNIYMKPMTRQGLKLSNSKMTLLENIRNTLAMTFSKIVDFYQDIITRKITLTPNEMFSQKHQELSQKLQSNSKNVAIKTNEYFNWRYSNFPGKFKYKLYDYLSDSGELEGFMVLREAIWNGKKTLKVVELVAQQNMMSPFIIALVKIAKTMNVELILFHCLNPVLATELKKHLFFQRSGAGGSNFMVYSNKEELNNRINEIDDWQVSFGESDMDFNFEP